jgi:myo-inositol-1(or 4)-monophosphatase
VEAEIKDDNTPVTTLDTELEHLMRKALAQFDSSIGFEGEELGKSGNEETFWLLDPIDGTESFIRGLPFVRNMATLIADGQPVFAFVYNPIKDELFTAIKGGGTFKNGQPIRVSQRPLDRAWIEISAPIQLPEVMRAVLAVRRQVNAISMIREFTLICEGKVDGQLMYKSGGGPWDYAPRALLAMEAGAKVSNIGSEGYDFRNNDMLIANPVIFDDLMATIMQTNKEKN